MYSYVCPDIVKEFQKYEAEGDKYFKRHEFIHSVTKKVWAVYGSWRGLLVAMDNYVAHDNSLLKAIHGGRRLRAFPRPRDLLQPRDCQPRLLDPTS